MNLTVAIFWSGVAWLAYVYAGYPLLAALAARFRRVRIQAREDYLPAVSVLIAARNEEKDIGWKIRETLDWDYPAERLEVLVASDASEDGTDAIVRAIKDPRLHFIRMERRGGKVRALNRLAEMARGEIFLLTDANASIPRECLRRLVRHLADPRVGCVTGITANQSQPAGAVSRGAGVYFRYESLIARWESALGSVLACDGAIHCVRRDLWAPLQPDLANDLELPLRVLHAGCYTLFEPGAYAVERETESLREEYRRRKRIAAQGALAMWRLRHTLRGLRAWQFVSHKLLRWLTPVPLAAVLAASLAQASQPFYAAALAGQAFFYGAAAIALWRAATKGKAPPVLAIPLYVVLGAAAALAGLIEAARGRSFDIWEIAALSRGAQDAEC